MRLADHVTINLKKNNISMSVVFLDTKKAFDKHGILGCLEGPESAVTGWKQNRQRLLQTVAPGGGMEGGESIAR
jgi:hypothetical protein